MILSLFRLSLILPKLLWELAGMKRAMKKGKRAFKRALIKSGMPPELAEELTKDYALLDEMLTLNGILKYAGIPKKDAPYFRSPGTSPLTERFKSNFS
ncbi:MAG: hypothetical protein J7K57_08180 [Palaeococcus sp.]|uniref:hypothetical protein n=1 Tax=Palaeococcus sp. (in: euryarchaeotes) TaxID=2820298 RepID=UPI0025D0EBE0|nr:hypothetical protein [Palaeococcus sp. (in: euryarchaeotes)]MCD6559825.1 hypothetical protein [Palaeococcus sp. (in: euryarchaeotes)]